LVQLDFAAITLTSFSRRLNDDGGLFFLIQSSEGDSMAEVFDVKTTSDQMLLRAVDATKNNDDASHQSLINMVRDLMTKPQQFDATMRKLNAGVKRDDCDNLLSVEFAFAYREEGWNSSLKRATQLVDFTIDESGNYKPPVCEPKDLRRGR
jgi:hypothetical protein